MAAAYRGNKSLLKKHIKRKTVQFSYLRLEATNFAIGLSVEATVIYFII